MSSSTSPVAQSQAPSYPEEMPHPPARRERRSKSFHGNGDYFISDKLIASSHAILSKTSFSCDSIPVCSPRWSPPKGTTYKGEKNLMGEPSGQGCLTNPKIRVVWQGLFKIDSGNLICQGVKESSNDNKLHCVFRNGLAQGQGKWRFNEGDKRIQIKGTFSEVEGHVICHGEKMVVGQPSYVQKGHFVDGILSGAGSATLHDIVKLEGEFNGEKLVGKGKISYGDLFAISGVFSLEDRLWMVEGSITSGNETLEGVFYYVWTLIGQAMVSGWVRQDYNSSSPVFGLCEFPDQTMMIGKFSNPAKDYGCEGILFKSDGSTYRGSFDPEGRQYGEGFVVLATKTKIHGTFKDDQLLEITEMIYANGETLVGTFSNEKGRWRLRGTISSPVTGIGKTGTFDYHSSSSLPQFIVEGWRARGDDHGLVIGAKLISTGKIVVGSLKWPDYSLVSRGMIIFPDGTQVECADLSPRFLKNATVTKPDGSRINGTVYIDKGKVCCGQHVSSPTTGRLIATKSVVCPDNQYSILA